MMSMKSVPQQNLPLRGTFPRKGKAFYMKTEKTYEQR